jgi:hypothetical protein
MAEIKISELPKAPYTKPSDKIMVVQNGVNKYIEFSDILNSMKSDDDIIFGGPAKLPTVDKPAEDSSAVYPTNIIFRSETGTDLLFLETVGKGRVSINGAPSLANAEFQIHGNVKIENLYLDSFDDVIAISDTHQPIIPLTTETSKLITYSQSSINIFKLGKGVPGQTKNLIYFGHNPETFGSGSVDSVSACRVAIDLTAVPLQSTAKFTNITLKYRGSGVVLKYIESTINNVAYGFWACVGQYEALFSK